MSDAKIILCNSMDLLHLIGLENQCNFGPRNPGSDGYDNCKTYLIDNLTDFADTVFTQDFEYTELRKQHFLQLNKYYCAI